jgi:hypothetical protein
MDAAKASQALQAALDPLCLAGVTINPESRVKVRRGPAPARLNEQGWRVFLVKVQNDAGVTAALRATSPHAAPKVNPEEVAARWLDVATYDQQPLLPKLSGLELEYRILQLYSRDRGKREATLAFDVGQGTQDLGFRNEVAVLFECEPAVRVTLEVRQWASLSSGTGKGGFIRLSRGGWSLIFSFTSRFTGSTASRSFCRRASMNSRIRAGLSTAS